MAEIDPQDDAPKTNEATASRITDALDEGVEDDPDALRRENTRLRSQVADHEAEKRANGHPWRKAAVVVLITLGCLLLAVANLAFWVQRTALNTNGWVAAVGPLSKSPIVAEAVSSYVVEELAAAVDIEQVAVEALPEELEGLSRPLSGAIMGLVQDVVAKVIESDQFNQIWVAANRAVHSNLVAVLRGDGSLLYVHDGQVTADFSELFEGVQDSLGIRDFGLIAEEDTRFVLFSDERLAGMQRVVALIDTVGLVLPLLAIATLVIAWLVSLTRRRTLMWIGVWISVTMVASLILFGLLKPIILAPIADAFFRTLVHEIWTTVFHTFNAQTVLVLVVGVLIAVVAWFAGPNQWAVDTRTDFGSWWDERKR